MNTIKAIQQDWENGLTHREIRQKHHYLDPGIESAITVWGEGLSIKQIKERIKHIQPFMKAKEIRTIMQGK